MIARDKHAREAAKCLRDAFVVLVVGILSILVVNFALSCLTGCETAHTARQDRMIATKAAHKAAYQKPPLPQSAMMIWFDAHWQDALKTAVGALALALLRKGRKG